MATPTAYLIMDIETVADGRLVQRVRYPDEPQLTPEQAVAKYRAQLLETSNGKSDFVPHTFQVPISVAIAKVAPDLSLTEVKTLDRPRYRPHVITRTFWRGWEKLGQPTLVTFNGRFFDLPVMEMAAYRYGLPVPAWFAPEARQYDQPRNRFNTKAHVDLQDLLGNQGATHIPGGLNLCAQLVGGAGKMDTKGQMVQELWERGERERIDNYCMCDVLDTYLAFLRCRLIQGLLDPAEERRLVAHAKTWIEQAGANNLVLAEYARTMRDWVAIGDEDDAFMR